MAASRLQVVEFGNELLWKLELKQWHPLRPVAVVSWARFVPHLICSLFRIKCNGYKHTI